MNNLQNHCDTFYTLVLPLKLQSIKDVYLRTVCLSNEKKNQKTKISFNPWIKTSYHTKC